MTTVQSSIPESELLSTISSELNVLAPLDGWLKSSSLELALLNELLVFTLSSLPTDCPRRGQGCDIESTLVVAFCIHGCSKISSRDSLCIGFTLSIDLMRCLRDADTPSRKNSSARQISSSFSNGMSPQAISNRSIPNDQTVAERPWYLWHLIHSGGLYTLVPAET